MSFAVGSSSTNPDLFARRNTPIRSVARVIMPGPDPGHQGSLSTKGTEGTPGPRRKFVLVFQVTD